MEPHWTWRAGPVEPGPAVVVDIDGVLSDAARRQHYLEEPWPDWRGFFDACGEDQVIEEVKILLDLLDPALRVVLLTGRPGPGPPPDRGLGRPLRHPVGRPAHARGAAITPSPGSSRRTPWPSLRYRGFDLRLAFEDDRRNAEMFRHAGVPCIYIHSGYYD